MVRDNPYAGWPMGMLAGAVAGFGMLAYTMAISYRHDPESTSFLVNNPEVGLLGGVGLMAGSALYGVFRHTRETREREPPTGSLEDVTDSL